jgi:DNA mismatch repair protein MutH
MQRSKTFHTFHLVHFGAISQSHAPQKFHDFGTNPKALPISAFLLESTMLYVFGGGATVGVTRLLGMLHSRKKYENKCQKLKHFYVLEF